MDIEKMIEQENNLRLAADLLSECADGECTDACPMYEEKSDTCKDMLLSIGAGAVYMALDLCQYWQKICAIAGDNNALS